MAHERLSLGLEDDRVAGPDELARIERLGLMRPGHAEAPFDDPDWFFEPWWPGTPARLILREDALRVLLEHFVDPAAAFPDLAGLTPQISGTGHVIEGTLLVLDDAGRPDQDLLRQRMSEPGEAVGFAAFVASDLLADGGRALVDWPFARRRARLAELVRDGERCVLSRGLAGEGRTLAQAVAGLGIGALSARRLLASYRPSPASDAYLRMPVAASGPVERRPLLALLQRLPLG